MNKNQWADEYDFPVVGIAYCKNTTENNFWCKTREQINEWLLTQTYKMVYQNTVVQPDMFKYDPLID